MPGTRCAIYGCNNNRKPKDTSRKYVFHRFPKPKDPVSKTIMNEWITSCKRKDQLNPHTSYICSVHFTENDYERDLKNELLGLPQKKILKKTAVPTLALYDYNRDYNEMPLRDADTVKMERHSQRQEVANLLETTSMPSHYVPEKSLVLEEKD